MRKQAPPLCILESQNYWCATESLSDVPQLTIIPSAEDDTPSSVNPDHIGEIWVRLGFMDKSGYTRVGVEQCVIDPNPTRVNEKDKKPGAHCAM